MFNDLYKHNTNGLPIHMGSYRLKGFAKEYYSCRGIPHYPNPTKQSNNIKKVYLILRNSIM